MATSYTTPGVYVEEISTLPASIAPVATAIPAFIGYTRQRVKNGVSFGINIPTRIKSLLEFEEIFGTTLTEGFTAQLTDSSTGGTLPDISIQAPTTWSPYSLYYHVKMYYGNGGGPCWIVSVGDIGTVSSNIDKDELKAGLNACEKEDEITLLVIPEMVEINTPASRKELNDAMLAQCAKLQDRFAVMDTLETDPAVDTVITMGDNFRNSDVGSNNLKYGATYFPSLQTTINYRYNLAEIAIDDNRTSGNIHDGLMVADLDGGLEVINAEGSLTVTALPAADDTIVVGTVTFTFKAADNTGDNIEITADEETLATSIKNKINAHASLSGIITASIDSEDDTVINLVAKGTMAGSAGNDIDLTGSPPEIVAVGFSGGLDLLAKGYITVDSVPAEDDTLTIAGIKFTFVTGAPAAGQIQIGVDETTTATNIKTAINADTTLKEIIEADADGDIVTLEALDTGSMKGVAGNSIKMSYVPDGVSHITLTDFSGGRDASDLALYNAIISKLKEKTVTLYPSATMCGVYATVDRTRGVWKAPANYSLNMVSKPNIEVTAEQQGLLNVDATSGKSINVIRTFTGKGVLVWGARTLAGNDNEWRYVPVRRLYIFIEESVKKATEFVVFEPNDANTWQKVKTMIENFLSSLWRDGALAGAKPDDAFFVKVGLGVTMTSLDILEGRMNIEIGMAAVRPAEFIILKFSHLLAKS